ncbi:MAG: phosphopantothenoylcysteine decarboxylase, partial [Flavobacteriales bacterium]|nr:phosphopantothenoylcysteine decarboxylase [Flavobacteriales bacterium]
MNLSGKKVLVTAGPTYEDIDPVRFIGNRSTGKMGYAIAQVCGDCGAEVALVSGPVNIHPTSDLIEVTQVRSAREMYDVCVSKLSGVDIVIMAAAVADYTPDTYSDKKIKKKEGDWSILFKRTNDILAELGRMKKAGQTLVGFALESENGIQNAKRKLKNKNLDFIVLNSLKDEGAGFGHDTNRITIIDKHNKHQEFELKSKEEVAIDIVRTIYMNRDE